MKVIMVYSYTDQSEHVYEESGTRLEISNKVVDIAGKYPTLEEIRKVEEDLRDYPSRCNPHVINVIRLTKEEKNHEI